jgi:hypothetical protein
MLFPGVGKNAKSEPVTSILGSKLHNASYSQWSKACRYSIFFFPVSFQGNLQHEYSGTDCRHLNGPEVHTEVSSLLEYLRLCMFFSKKTFSAFLKFGGYNQEDILIHKARARVSK